MLNVIWPLFIICAFVYGIIFGKADEINSSIFSSTKEAVELSINLLRYNVFVEWNYEDSI